MPDLRDRIAETVWVSHRDRQLAQLGMKPGEYPSKIPVPDWAYAIADALIRELGELQIGGTQCGGCRDLGAHSPRCVTQPGYRWCRAADMAENIGDLIGSNDIELANEAYRLMGELRMRWNIAKLTTRTADE